jgi:uncharacterized protein (TIGR02452 family)
MNVSRRTAAQHGKEIVAILRAGHYDAATGGRIDLAEDLRRAVEGTVDYAPDDALPRYAPAGHATHVEVENESTLAAARRLVRDGHRAVALNFASARHPGGGFLNGARA